MDTSDRFSEGGTSREPSGAAGGDRMPEQSLYDRLGGVFAIAAVIDHLGWVPDAAALVDDGHPVAHRLRGGELAVREIRKRRIEPDDTLRRTLTIGPVTRRAGEPIDVLASGTFRKCRRQRRRRMLGGLAGDDVTRTQHRRDQHTVSERHRPSRPADHCVLKI